MCSELVYPSYQLQSSMDLGARAFTGLTSLDLELSSVMGRTTLPPTDMVSQFDKEYGTDIQKLAFVASVPKAMIDRGDIDVAIAGGTEAGVCEIAVAGFSACMALSKNNDDPQGASRPFDAERDGFVLGEGAGVLVLESIEHAMARGAQPLAELAGYGATSDAFHVTQPGPGGVGAARAMTLAMNQAGVSPDEVDYINAHGTSTPLNDKPETCLLGPCNTRSRKGSSPSPRTTASTLGSARTSSGNAVG